MLKPYRLLVSLTLLGLVLSASSWAQSGPPSGGGPSGLYNPNTVVTLSGLVIAKTPPSAKGLPQLIYLTLKTETGKKTVFLGPDFYIDKLPLQIQTLDKITVTGSEIIWEGKPVIIAAEIKKGNEVLKLRNTSGVPGWSGRGRPSP